MGPPRGEGLCVPHFSKYKCLWHLHSKMQHNIISFIILTNMSISNNNKSLDKCILRVLNPCWKHDKSKSCVCTVATARTKRQQRNSREYAWIKYDIEASFQSKRSMTISTYPAHMQ